MIEQGEKRGLYPEIEPNHSGRLDVGDGHELYYEECGNPRGKPVVFLHGGPGGGCNDKMRRFFNRKMPLSTSSLTCPGCCWA